MVSSTNMTAGQPAVGTALADTGANLCIMNRTTWQRIAWKDMRLDSSSTVIGLADQNFELKTLGETECNIVMKTSPTQSTIQRVVVVESAGYDMFLSRRALTELGVLPAGFPNNIVKPTAAAAAARPRPCGCG